MKLILGDNQFFGINHHDLQKGSKTKEKFQNSDDIENFIKNSIELGLDGFMINSNKLGFEVVEGYKSIDNEEIHYSIPYPHKYATMVNEEGMLSLLKYFLKKTSIFKLLIYLPMFLLTRNIKYLVPLVIQLELPKNLTTGSTIYIQNIITDLIIGIDRFDILEQFCVEVRKKGYKPGFITLNPLKLNKLIKISKEANKEDLTVCFNLNNIGFNVFPSLNKVEDLIRSKPRYKIMVMSIFASGGSEIKTSIEYVKTFSISHVVFGTSKLHNLKNNIEFFRN